MALKERIGELIHVTSSAMDWIKWEPTEAELVIEDETDFENDDLRLDEETGEVLEIADNVRGTLTIQFRRSTYEYERVPFRVADEFCRSDSKGTYFNKYIRRDYVGTQV